MENMSSVRPRIRIVLSGGDRALERLGRVLAARLPDVDLGDTPDAQADINYYIPLNGRSTAVSTREIGWVPSDTGQGDHGVDLVICPDAATRDALLQSDVGDVVVIPQGLLEGTLETDVQIGVARQTDDPKMPKITGITWRYIDTAAMDQDPSGICRTLDYVLVSGRSAAGTFLASVAQASGTPIIAGDAAGLDAQAQQVFRTDDADDLSRVLLAAVAAAQARCRAAEDLSWDAFADAHARAFDRVCTQDETAYGAADPSVDFAGPVRLLLHGDEHKSLGGPSVRVPRTAQTLRMQGVAAQAAAYTGAAADITEEMVHLFNVWNPASALLALEQLKAAGKRVVLSPIYLDLRACSFWQAQLPDLPLDDLEAHAATYAKALAHLEGRGRLFEPVAGYNAMVRAMLDMADHVIFLSQAERDALENLGAAVEDDRASLVPNPVDAALWQSGDPDLFRDTYLKDLPGPQDYVLCVGRIEERKNQLLLARAMRDLPLRLVLVGHAGNPAYAERVRAAAGPDFLIVDRLDVGGEMLCGAVAGARVFCLPSWAEGASLAALEAAAAGAQMVLGDHSSERAYFGDLATYCDVGDPRSIRDAIASCLEMPSKEKATHAQALKAKIAQEYSWDAHATATARAYAQAVKNPPRAVGPALGGLGVPAVRGDLVFDLTALAHDAQGHSQGARTQALLVKALRGIAADVRFVCWNDDSAGFIDLPDAAAAPVSAWRYCTGGTGLPQDSPVHASLTQECTLVVAGDFWRHDADYLSGLADLKARSGCALVPLIEDLDPLAFPFRYDGADAGAFQRGFNRLARLADGFLTVSQATAQRTRDAVARLLPEVPPITPIRLGAAARIQTGNIEPSALSRVFVTRQYVLAAGPVDARANLDMLIRVWTRFADADIHADLHLVIAGDVAPSAHHIPDRIARDPRLAARVHTLSGLGDGDLDWLYHNCLFTVFAAHDTDRALPVAQSLAYAKPCLASSAGAVPEIAPDLVEQIDPEDFTTWHRRISRYAASPALRHKRAQTIAENYSAVSWEETAQALVETVRVPRAVRGAVPVFAGAPIDAGMQGGVTQAFFGEGWHPREGWGRWAAAKCCDVTLNLSRQASGDVDIIPVMMHLALCPDGGRPRQLTVGAGAQVLFDAPVFGGDVEVWCDIIVLVPTEALDAQGCITLALDMPLAWQEPQTPATATTRQVGIGLVRMVVLDKVLCNPLHALRSPALWSTGNTGVMIDMVDPAHRAAMNTLGVGDAHEFSPAWGQGSRAGRCNIAVPVLPCAEAQTVHVTCRPVATQNHAVIAEFYWNGRHVAKAVWNDDRTVRIEIALSVQDMAVQAPHVLSVRTDSLLVPVDLGLGLTESIAGVGVFGVEMLPQEQTG